MDEELIELEGFITFYKFENEETGYRIALFKIDDNKNERTICIVGYFPHFSKQDALKIKGKQINHKKYGLQIEVSEIYKKIPESKENIVRFLSSSKFKGIGKSIATKIYDFLGENSIDLLINDPKTYDNLLNEGIVKDKHIDSLKEGLRDFDYSSNLFQVLLKYGFSLKNIMKVEATYSVDAENVIKNNPYQIVYDIDGIGFTSVDKIALSMGFKEDDIKRIEAAIMNVIINLSFSTGNTYTSKNSIVKGLKKLVIIDEDIFETALNNLINKKYVIVDNDRYFYYKLYNSEINIANSLKPFINSNMHKALLLNNFDNIIKNIEEDEGISYSNEQKEAIYGALSNRLFIISGGPGTGKTTILKAILKIFKGIYGDDGIIALCAPTGRAAKRMSNLTNNYASTIHRLLKWDLHSNTFSYNANNKLHADVIIIDEFSMVDSLLFEALLVGTTNVSQIVIIGDDGQLPSVGAGNLLHDLLDIDSISKMHLTHIYRQLDGSSIVSLANLIRNNKLDESFEFNNEVKFIKAYNHQAAEIMGKLFLNLLEKGYDLDNFQTIIPMYSNVAGIDNVNSLIQQLYNPKDDSKNEIRVGHQIFREGDRVLQLKNQPEDDIFNGDIGVIIEIDNEEEEMVVNFDIGEVIIPKALYSNLTLAYAISVHKSQGSEFDFVVMSIFNDYNAILNKQLIYTAVSRAKKGLVIIGDYKCFIKKANEESRIIRYTALKERFN